MAYALGLKALRRLCEEQDPIAWQRAKLSTALFKPNEIGAFQWVSNHLQKNHALPQITTLEGAFPEFAGMETVEPSSYYVGLLENSYFQGVLNQANLDSQSILKENQNAYEKAAAVLQSALNAITLQKYRLRIVDLGIEGPSALITAYHNVGLLEHITQFGWEYLDSQAGGGQPGDVISFVGRPAAGKTWLTVWSALQNWKAKTNTLFVSMEMQPLPIMQRVASIYAGLPISQMKMGGFSSSSYNKFSASMKAMKAEEGKFFIVDGNLAASVEDIYILADQLECHAIYIDGAYLVRHPDTKLDRFRRVAENVELMKRHTTALGAATFASWQFNRDASKKVNKAGKMDASLDEIGYSDAIGQVSSIVCGLFQEDGVETMLKRTIRVLKGRNGEVGQFDIAWDFVGMNFGQVDQHKVIEGVMTYVPEKLHFL